MLADSSFVLTLKHFDIYQPEELYKIVCPFHGDVNPSLQINLNKEFWYCYGCGKHGGALELVKEFSKLNKKQINDIQALKQLKKIGGAYPYNLTITNNSFVETQTITYSQGIKLAKDYYFNLPNTNWYKFDTDEAEENLLIKRYMQKRGFKTKTLIKSEAKASYNKLYPIVFPMYDNGMFRGYVMRTMDPEVEQKRKYMYNKGFKRERTLAGDYREDTVILVEGFLDKIKANQLGLQNVAATLGWKITGTQFKKLQRKKIKKIICAYDNDEYGDKGFRYLKRLTKETGISVVRLHYPKGIKDMGDLNKENSGRILIQIKRYGGS